MKMYWKYGLIGVASGTLGAGLILSLSSGVRNLGSVAEWMSAIGTLMALWFVVYQVNKGNDLTRALEIEEARPRFVLSFGRQIPDRVSPILFAIEDLADVKDRYSKGGTLDNEVIFISNISENVTYESKIALSYHTDTDATSMTEVFGMPGFQKNEMTAPLLPRIVYQAGVHFEKLYIGFVTKMNERGVAIWEIPKDRNDSKINGLILTGYYFETCQNKEVIGVGSEQFMISSEEMDKIRHILNDLSIATQFKY